ncbi:hypothetical protein KBB05_03125 [Patescibacteria group bacterium]|nr:hypothetical protein [Patescibacteria group bacterium]
MVIYETILIAMQKLSAYLTIPPNHPINHRTSVLYVTQYRVSYEGEMSSDLVHSSGEKFAGDQG